MPQNTKDPYQYERMLRERMQQAQQGRTQPPPPRPGPSGPRRPADPAEELRRNIQELGFTIADEVGRSLRGAADEVRRSTAGSAGRARRQERAAYNYQFRQQARQMGDQMASRVNRASAGWSESLRSGLSVFGGTLCVCGAVGCGLALIGLLIATVVGAVTAQYDVVLVCGILTLVFGLFTGAFTAMGRWLLMVPAKRQRMRRYLAAMGEETAVPVQRLAEAVQRPVPFVKKEISKMIRQGWLPNAYLDDQEDVFFINAEEYRALQRKQEAAARAAAGKETPKTAQDELDELMQQGRDFITLLDEHIRATGAEPEVCGQLEHMRTTAGDIMSWVAAHPQSAGKVRRFARYYMPTTLKLLRTYDDVKGQQSDVASGIRQDIGGILGTLNTAFDNLQADLLSDTALDVSSEISAMQTMLAQDGLSAENFISKE